MKRLLWLDDIRDPFKNEHLKYSPIDKPFDVFWVKTYAGFIDWINENGLPDAICFDHDLSDFQAFCGAYPEQLEDMLAEGKELGKEKEWEEKLAIEKTGYDCAKWLTNYCTEKEKELPRWNVQSANPVGKENINKHLSNYFIKHI